MSGFYVMYRFKQENVRRFDCCSGMMMMMMMMMMLLLAWGR